MKLLMLSKAGWPGEPTVPLGSHVSPLTACSVLGAASRRHSPITWSLTHSCPFTTVIPLGLVLPHEKSVAAGAAPSARGGANSAAVVPLASFCSGAAPALTSPVKIGAGWYWNWARLGSPGLARNGSTGPCAVVRPAAPTAGKQVLVSVACLRFSGSGMTEVI